MKKFNKVLAVALAVLMLAMTAVPAFAGDWYMTEGTDCHVIIGKDDVWYFVPEYSGCYTLHTNLIYADDEADPCVEIYDSEDCVVASNDDYYGLEAAVCFYAIEGEKYEIRFFDGSGNKNSDYEAVIYGNACGDFDYDGYCDGCYDLLCDCDCHEGGILGFFWSIKNFFNRLFRINEVCDCGAWHW